MDRRRLLMMLAVLVAVIGTALVFLYVKGADNRAQSKVASAVALQATQDVTAGESYDAALAAGKIVQASVPQSVLDASTGYQAFSSHAATVARYSRLAATSSCVDSGFDATSTRSADQRAAARRQPTCVR